MRRYYWYCSCGCIGKKLFESRIEAQARASRHLCGGEVTVTYTKHARLPEHPTWKTGLV